MRNRALTVIDRLKNTDRTHDLAGASWPMIGPLLLSGAFCYDHMRNATTSAGRHGSGNRYTVVALVQYSLSKRTTLYGTPLNFNKADGPAAVGLSGRDRCCNWPIWNAGQIVGLSAKPTV